MTTAEGSRLQHPNRRRAPEFGADRPFAADPHQTVVGHTIQPRAGIVWTALSRPTSERGQECTLDRVFDDVEMAHADLARQQRHQPAVFVPKEMFDEARRGGHA